MHKTNEEVACLIKALFPVIYRVFFVPAEPTYRILQPIFPASIRQSTCVLTGFCQLRNECDHLLTPIFQNLYNLSFNFDPACTVTHVALFITTVTACLPSSGFHCHCLLDLRHNNHLHLLPLHRLLQYQLPVQLKLKCLRIDFRSKSILHLIPLKQLSGLYIKSTHAL